MAGKFHRQFDWKVVLAYSGVSATARVFVGSGENQILVGHFGLLEEPGAMFLAGLFRGQIYQ